MSGPVSPAGPPGTPPATSGLRPLDLDEAARGFTGLIEVMDRLRSPGGCAWDARQTHESLVKYLVEESYEVIEAIESDGGPAAHRQDLIEELGDLLLQVIFHARVAQERDESEGGFTVSDVLEAITGKLIRRHPQVFAPEYRDTLGTQASNEALHARWEEIKKQEKPERKGPFDGIPPGLPALQYAEKVLAKARRHGLDADPDADPGGGEPGRDPDGGLPPAAPSGEEELGERLFQLVQQASAAGLDPERALRSTARRWAGDREDEGTR